MRAPATGVSMHRALRLSPRRSFSFQVLADARARRVAEMLLSGYSGIWQLPIWPDRQMLSAPLSSGAVSIPCITSGYDFSAGGKALLYGDVNVFEIVTVDSVASDHIGLASATVATWPRGTSLYPLRAARVQDGATERLQTDDLGLRSLVFDIVESCDSPSLAPPTLYLTHPVLDRRPDESDDPSASVSRKLQSVDYGQAVPVVVDAPRVGFGMRQLHWQLYGRAEHSWFRSLAYTLAGRSQPIWVPSWTSDLKPVAAVAGGSATMAVEWAGYTLFGKNKANRKDVRIELNDGTVFYRRINNAIEAGATETLTLSSSLSGSSIAPAQIRAISFMALSTLASDSVELQHETDADGIATATTSFQAVVPDV